MNDMDENVCCRTIYVHALKDDDRINAFHDLVSLCRHTSYNESLRAIYLTEDWDVLDLFPEWIYDFSRFHPNVYLEVYSSAQVWTKLGQSSTDIFIQGERRFHLFCSHDHFDKVNIGSVGDIGIYSIFEEQYEIGELIGKCGSMENMIYYLEGLCERSSGKDMGIVSLHEKYGDRRKRYEQSDNAYKRA